MSAPITAYRKKSFFTRYNNTNVEHLIAIIQQSDAIHLSRFYLDGYMPVRLDDGKEGGIGYVIIGGENATMHNLNKRGGSQRMRVGGDVVQLLNDAGLNTLGFIDDIETGVVYEGVMTVRSSALSAYWIDTDVWGVQIKKVDESWKTAYTETESAADKQFYPLNVYIPKGSAKPLRYHMIRPERFAKNDSLNIRLFIKNAEGTYFDVAVNRSVVDTANPILSSKVANACDNTVGETVGFWSLGDTEQYIRDLTIQSEHQSGHYLYKIPLGDIEDSYDTATGQLIPADAGWYRILVGGSGSTPSTEKDIRLDANGQIVQYNDCPEQGDPEEGTVIGTVALLSDVYGSQELIYTVSRVITTAYTVTGQIQEYVGTIPVGSPRNFAIDVAADSNTPVYTTVPSLVKSDPTNGKFRFQNVGSNNFYVINTINEF